MAKFTDYTEKTEPVDTDLALIYDTPAKVNKKFTFGNLWNWIVKKLTSAVINELHTSSKNVVGAINELNSKRLYGSTSSISVDVKSRAGILIIGHPSIEERNAMYFFCCSVERGILTPIIEPNEIIQVILETTTLKITTSEGTFNYRIYF